MKIYACSIKIEVPNELKYQRAVKRTSQIMKRKKRAFCDNVDNYKQPLK